MKKDCLTLCMLGNFSCFFLSSGDFFQKQLFWKIVSGILSECQTVWILIRPEVLKVSCWDRSMSIVVVHRQQFALNDNSSYTTRPLLTKLHRYDCWMKVLRDIKICSVFVGGCGFICLNAKPPFWENNTCFLKKADLTLCMLHNFSWFLLYFKSTFPKIISGIPSVCQTVWIQIRTNILLVPIWVQTVSKVISRWH